MATYPESDAIFTRSMGRLVPMKPADIDEWVGRQVEAKLVGGAKLRGMLLRVPIAPPALYSIVCDGKPTDPSMPEKLRPENFVSIHLA
jgi:hypothetical protein